MIRQAFIVFVVVYTTIFLPGADGHGAMVKPISWFDFPSFIKLDNGSWVHDYASMKKRQQCAAGLTIPREILCPDNNNCDGYEFPGPSCNWFTNNTSVEEPTLFDPALRTFARVQDPKLVLLTPWRAPGAAPIASPCGVSGGNPNGCGGPKCGQKAGGYAFGIKAEETKFVHKIYTTEWKLGDVVEVAWGILVNHGGGYSYRLCRLSEETGRKGVTEECFQQTPLKFSGEKQWIQYGDNETARLEIPAVRTDNGTVPVGSQWTKNPIPACVGQFGGLLDPHQCTQGTQFPQPGPGLCGFGINILGTMKRFPFYIVDKVVIPEHLEPGDYVLSFRWDTEQGFQVWNTCSNIRLH